jgi:hypothetical protein
MDLADALGQASTLTALIGTAVLVWKWVAARYRATLGSRSHLRERLYLLACGMTIKYVDALFGTPTMQWEGPRGLDQRAYWTKHGWLSTLTPSGQDMVWAFSFTVTDPRFALPIASFANGNINTVIGRSRFAVAPNPGAWRFFEGSHNSEYVEAHDFGNLGFYQVYLLSASDTGFGDLRLSRLHRDVPDKSGTTLGADDARVGGDPLPESLAAFRRAATPNTFVVLGPDLPYDFAKDWMPVGIHYERVRVFPMHPRPQRSGSSASGSSPSPMATS